MRPYRPFKCETQRWSCDSNQILPGSLHLVMYDINTRDIANSVMLNNWIYTCSAGLYMQSVWDEWIGLKSVWSRFCRFGVGLESVWNRSSRFGVGFVGLGSVCLLVGIGLIGLQSVWNRSYRFGVGFESVSSRPTAADWAIYFLYQDRLASQCDQKNIFRSPTDTDSRRLKTDCLY